MGHTQESSALLRSPREREGVFRAFSAHDPRTFRTFSSPIWNPGKFFFFFSPVSPFLNRNWKKHGNFVEEKPWIMKGSPIPSTQCPERFPGRRAFSTNINP